MEISDPLRFIEGEVRAILTRLEQVQPFSLHMPMLAASSVSPEAQLAMERHLLAKRARLRERVLRFLDWLQGVQGRRASPAAAQRKFLLIRLGFHAVLAHFDIFSDVLTQRSEHRTGVWLSGLDAVARDALRLPAPAYRIPPVMCYLDRGHGAAIRRIHTRLPGGGMNPVAIIRVPRERMVGVGMASSLVHEVGHQASALLDLVNSFRPTIRRLQETNRRTRRAWGLWGRWLSEIWADFWGVARVGVAASLGLLGVLSLPCPFVFRFLPGEIHPVPWIRMGLSCAIGQALYPHPQWRKLTGIWNSLYPTRGLGAGIRNALGELLGTVDRLAALLACHRPAKLKGASLAEALEVDRRKPAKLEGILERWRRGEEVLNLPPTLLFAALGQGRFGGQLGPAEESRRIAALLEHKAFQAALDASRHRSRGPIRCGPALIRKR